MAASRFTPADRGRQMSSPRPKGGRDTKDTLCRNVLIYGHCRYEDQGCAFNHDQTRNSTNSSENKKSLNVESPSFTPATTQAPGKKFVFSSQAANAAPFTPKAAAASTVSALPQENTTTVFNPDGFQEFKPSNNYDLTATTPSNGAVEGGINFDPFNMPAVGQALHAAQYNPYADERNTLAGAGTAYYQAQSGYTAPPQPLQYHLYAPMGPHRADLQPYHRQPHDFFIPENIHQDLTRKTEASLQVLPNSQLPSVDHYHSLCPLDTSSRKSSVVFGLPSWLYKTTSGKNGRIYCLRRIEGFRLTDDQAIRSVQQWKRISNGNVVTLHDAFTSRAFGDSSLIFVQDYHPCSKTLAEFHFPSNSSSRYGRTTTVSESVLWSYIVQLANALKAIHSQKLAARCLDISKIILTDKNRIRLSACSILDVLQYQVRRPIGELQQEDFVQLGRLILCIASNTAPNLLNNPEVALNQLSRTYSAELKDRILWLLSPPQLSSPKTVETFLQSVSHHVMNQFDAELHRTDIITSVTSTALENGRIARLMAKLGTINERPEFDNDPNWSENGERYMLKLFRDYVFHKVNADGTPHVDLGWIIMCLNKLDAGTEERIELTSRDNQTTFIVTYRELKRAIGSAFADLTKPSKQARGYQN